MERPAETAATIVEMLQVLGAPSRRPAASGRRGAR
jgi:hypothetical protein